MWIVALMACGLFQSEPSTEGNQTEAAIQEVETTTGTASTTDKRYNATLVLDGKEVAVRWDDGDTFSTAPTKNEKPIKARLNGFNTLESYGPVHKWDRWRFRTLYKVAKQAGERAASESWNCKTLDGQGGYGRALVDCPDLRLALLTEGLAHNFIIDTAIESKYLSAQAKAVKDRAGMWQKGAPTKIVTSLHSAAEQKDGKKPYDRLVSVRTGLAEKFEHDETYETCQRVCRSGSCMIYVPFEQRHGSNIAECLVILSPEDKEIENNAEIAAEEDGEDREVPPTNTLVSPTQPNETNE